VELPLLDHYDNSEVVVVNEPKAIDTIELVYIRLEMSEQLMPFSSMLLDLFLGDAGLWSIASERSLKCGSRRGGYG
jgi:hypothetical protein